MTQDELVFEKMTFDNAEKAYEIDRSDIPYSTVEDVPTLINTLKFGAEYDLIGHAFLISTNGKYIGTIMMGEGIFCDTDPEQFEDIPFYRIMFFVLDKDHRSKGYGSRIIEETIRRVYDEYGERPILLEVQEDNEDAMRFYENNGFVKTKYMEGDDYFFVRGYNGTV